MDFIVGKSKLYDKNISPIAAKSLNKKEKSYLSEKLNQQVVVCPKCGKIPEVRRNKYSDGARYVSVLCSCRAGSNRIEPKMSMKMVVHEAVKNWCNN